MDRRDLLVLRGDRLQLRADLLRGQRLSRQPVRLPVRDARREHQRLPRHLPPQGRAGRAVRLVCRHDPAGRRHRELRAARGCCARPRSTSSASVAAAATIYYWISRALTRPIGRLDRGMGRVADGDLEVRLPVTSDDEVGRAISGFNEMVDGLAERQYLRDIFGKYMSESVADADPRRPGAHRPRRRHARRGDVDVHRHRGLHRACRSACRRPTWPASSTPTSAWSCR